MLTLSFIGGTSLLDLHRKNKASFKKALIYLGKGSAFRAHSPGN